MKRSRLSLSLHMEVNPLFYFLPETHRGVSSGLCIANVASSSHLLNNVSIFTVLSVHLFFSLAAHVQKSLSFFFFPSLPFFLCLLLSSSLLFSLHRYIYLCVYVNIYIYILINYIHTIYMYIKIPLLKLFN